MVFKCISVVIAKAASRNIAFKVVKMSEALLEAQSSSLSRCIVGGKIIVDHDCLEDLGRYIDLHIFNHDVV